MIDNYKLWKDYKENGDRKARESLITKYLSLVKYQAGRIKMMVPQFIEKEDLEGFGVIGLLDAVEKYEYKRGIEFSTYASKRIRGEIIDHLRSLDWLPHSMRSDGKKIKKVVEKLKNKIGRKPTVDEISAETDISRERINKLYYKLYSANWVSLDMTIGEGENTILDTLSNPENENFFQKYKDKNKIKILSKALDKLPENEKMIISLYYYEELTQVEIAEVMNLSEARISQLHKKAIYRLRGFLSRKKEHFV